ncbi:MAG: YbhB/YbcL family Raf kinase inhibitor-like protein [Cetobacterium sp.]
MKKLIIGLLATLSISAFALDFSSPAIKDGIIPPQYGTYGKEQFKGMPTLSIPFQWKDAPKGTKEFALVMEDFDAVEAVGVVWIHWVTLIPGNSDSLAINASATDPNLIQGANSWVSKLGGSLPLDEVSRYGGPVPPNKTHTYTMTLYALDKKLNLKKGFYLNELYDAMAGHVLAQKAISGDYIKK